MRESRSCRTLPFTLNSCSLSAIIVFQDSVEWLRRDLTSSFSLIRVLHLLILCLMKPVEVSSWFDTLFGSFRILCSEKNMLGINSAGGVVISLSWDVTELSFCSSTFVVVVAIVFAVVLSVFGCCISVSASASIFETVGSSFDGTSNVCISLSPSLLNAVIVNLITCLFNCVYVFRGLRVYFSYYKLHD